MELMVYKKINTLIIYLFFSLTFISFQLLAQEQDKSIEDLDLDELLNQRVSLHRESDTASGVSESLMNAPAAMVILTKDEISRRGYLSLDEILSDLPGFDTITTNGTFPSSSYQRGYRTPRTQRTLLLINGKVDNHLWNHTAIISKQYPIQAIERVEVLYGPAGAVYGPNAFLGVINVITRDPLSLKANESYLSSQFIVGDFNTHGIDFTAGGHLSELNFVISGKLYESDGPANDDYSDWGFNRAELLSDEEIWGEAIANSDFDNDGSKDQFAGTTLGVYGDATFDESLIAEFGYKNWKLGAIYWQIDEGYGPYFPFDKGQPNVSWFHDSAQYYLEHFTEFNLLKINSELLYRESNVWGYWAENFGGWVSLSNWNAYNTAWRFRQNYSVNLSQELQLSGGIKYERKNLTKAYTVCGYWSGSLCPSDEGGISQGLAIRSGDERDLVPLPEEFNRDQFDPLSKSTTTDKGLYLQAIYDHNNWRFNGGLRWDNNSEYGSVVSPRGAVIYHYSPVTTFKLVYGEAFQEASARSLYGGWTGRNANPSLTYEEVANIEFIAIHQTDHFLHDVSIFSSKYNDVIVNAGSGNIGERDVWGVEYRGKMNIDNPFFDGEDITAQIYYTYNDAQGEFQFIQGYNEDGSSAWVNKEDDTGDIAPHKVNLILDFPFSNHWGLSLQTNWVSERKLFSLNPLRAEYNENRAASDNRKAEAYLSVDMHLRYRTTSFDAGLRVENIFSADYLLPGVESANSGDDFDNPSAGFNNSLLPQVNKPVVMAYFTIHF
jgi:iron complex outermembrane receptor protein